MTQINFAKTFESWTVYSHADQSGKILWVGLCRLAQLMDATDARKNSEWRKVCQPLPSLDLTIHMISEDITAAGNVRSALIRSHSPHCNLHGYEIAGAGRIECIETGEVFESAAVACRHFGIAPPAMSNHIKHTPGYKTLKGHTFRRI